MPWSRLPWTPYFWGKNCSPCAGVTCQGNHFEFIPTVSMESQHSVGVPICHDFPRFVFISEKSRPEVGSRWRRSCKIWRLWKKTLYGQIFTNVFQKDSWRHRSMFCVQIWWNLADRKSAKSCIIYLTKKNKTSARSRFCADRTQNLSGPAPSNMLGVPQISSKSVHFRRTYSRTREHRWNAPQSISNTPVSYTHLTLPTIYSV